MPHSLRSWYDFGAKPLQRVIREGIWASPPGARGPVWVGEASINGQVVISWRNPYVEACQE